MTTLKATFARLIRRLPVEHARPWKIALFVGVFLLPGGTLGVLALAWLEHRRARRATVPSLTAGRDLPRLPATAYQDEGPLSVCQDCPAT